MATGKKALERSAWEREVDGMESSESRLIEQLRAEEAGPRLQAINVLKNTQSPVAVQALNELLDDPDEHIRVAVTYTLGKITLAEVIPALIRA